LKGTNTNRRWFILVFVAAGLAVGVWAVVRRSGTGRSDASAEPSQPAQQSSKISCLGHIEPKDGVVRIAARSISGQPSIVRQLNVREGDRVKAGRVIAVLDSSHQLEAAARDLEAKVIVARERLALVKAGAKKPDIAAQEAEIARLRAALASAQVEFDRCDQLYRKQAATGLERNQKQTVVETTTQMLNGARSKLLSLGEVREADVKLSEAEIQAAAASAAKARAEYDASVVRAPFNGQVLKIHAHPGEEVGPNGVVELGRTDQIYVIAEVPEQDVGRLRIGQEATIAAEAFPEPLHGKVESIGLQVAKEDVQHTDPASLSDARVVEVKIRLDDSAKASRLIHGQVTAVIGP
jgi:HlyD family secretion protein